jgi:hypothetical protein
VRARRADWPDNWQAWAGVGALVGAQLAYLSIPGASWRALPVFGVLGAVLGVGGFALTRLLGRLPRHTAEKPLSLGRQFLDLVGVLAAAALLLASTLGVLWVLIPLVE